MENREPKFDAITGESIEGLPDRTAPTELPTDDDSVSEMLRGTPDFYDPNHWCEQQQELQQKVERLEFLRNVWIASLLLVIGAMGWIMWEQKGDLNLYKEMYYNLQKEMCSKTRS